MARRANPFTDAVGIEHPIVQAPMAGGATTPELGAVLPLLSASVAL